MSEKNFLYIYIYIYINIYIRFFFLLGILNNQLKQLFFSFYRNSDIIEYYLY